MKIVSASTIEEVISYSFILERITRDSAFWMQQRSRSLYTRGDPWIK